MFADNFINIFHSTINFFKELFLLNNLLRIADFSKCFFLNFFIHWKIFPLTIRWRLNYVILLFLLRLDSFFFIVLGMNQFIKYPAIVFF